ncbi:MAG: ribonuclease III [Pseudohongiellaceae bacterium]
MSNPIDTLQKSLSHQFTDLSLLKQALTHRSAAKTNNERFEFLGDSLLGFIVAELLYEQYPNAAEGELSRMRASMVNKPALAALARRLELGDYLRLGSGEKQSGGAARDSILSDAVEAVIAAIYLDGGIEACKTQVRAWALAQIRSQNTLKESKDPKTQLQELMQAKGLVLPNYEVVKVEGEAHDQMFTVSCLVAVLDAAKLGTGRSKRAAEQMAAAEILRELGADID